MPRSLRTSISSASAIWSTRWPLTHTTPASAFNSPTMILSAVDFPDPLAPRMIFVCPLMSVKLRSRRTTLSSKASCTRSNTTTGAPTSASTCFAVRPLAVAFMSAGIDREYEDLRDEEVCRDDCDGSGDDRQRRRLADTLRAAARPQPDVTRDSHDDESEDERLDEPHPHVLHVQ